MQYYVIMNDVITRWRNNDVIPVQYKTVMICNNRVLLFGIMK